MTEPSNRSGETIARILRAGHGASFLIAVMVLLFAGNPAWAARQCTLTVTSISFGSYLPAQAAPVSANGNVNVRCRGKPNQGQPAFYVLRLSAGSSGSFIQRYMQKAPGQEITYNVYVDAQYENIWGDGSPGTSLIQQTFPCQRNGANCNGKYNANHPAYGRAEAYQDPEPGYYSDSLVVFLTF